MIQSDLENQPMNKNIEYKCSQISEYYSQNRCKWDEFYPSERWIFEAVADPDRRMGKVLDVGCAVGGLGMALLERFTVESYHGIDINAPAIEVARSRKTLDMCSFEHGDILQVKTLPEAGFDNVFSLSCADWNIASEDIIDVCWRYVREEGHFILTMRLTPEGSLLDMDKSFQYIYFGDELPEMAEGLEKAPYVVFNVRDAFALLHNLQPHPREVRAFGYWNKPSKSARTKYDQLVFAAFAIKKGGNDGQHEDTKADLRLPLTLFL